MIPGTYRYQDRWKWFLPASRSFLNPPEPSGKAENLSFRTRMFRENIVTKKSLVALLTLFLGTPLRGDGPDGPDGPDGSHAGKGKSKGKSKDF